MRCYYCHSPITNIPLLSHNKLQGDVTCTSCHATYRLTMVVLHPADLNDEQLETRREWQRKHA